MEATKNAGIWMDHSSANFIDLNSEKNSFTIQSEFTYQAKSEALDKGENLMHHKEQQLHAAFYKKIADGILKYDHVVLFGPTNAKKELHNFLNKDLHFKDIKIDVKPADKLTDQERLDFVKNHFKK